MAKYHFVKHKDREVAIETIGDKVTSEHKSDGTFDRLYYFDDSKKKLSIKDCLGSIIVIDRLNEETINKLHIGELLIRNPHAENYRFSGCEGPRIDLHQVDLLYAQQRLEELIRWKKDPEHRTQLLQRYSEKPISNWYSTLHRLEQLKISSQGLETKISEMQQQVELLQNQPNNCFVSDKAKELEQNTGVLISLIYQEARKLLEPQTKGEARKPKIIYCPRVLSSAEEIYSTLKDVLKFIAGKEEYMKDISKYWQEVDGWANM